ncbi:hypothetical protein Bbelb_237660 [Branchiostoma belcheri]|nr:hypothetical protein Bbelb_237660 [Branchiostoma belcheri]
MATSLGHAWPKLSASNRGLCARLVLKHLPNLSFFPFFAFAFYPAVVRCVSYADLPRIHNRFRLPPQFALNLVNKILCCAKNIQTYNCHMAQPIWLLHVHTANKLEVNAKDFVKTTAGSQTHYKDTQQWVFAVSGWLEFRTTSGAEFSGGEAYATATRLHRRRQVVVGREVVPSAWLQSEQVCRKEGEESEMAYNYKEGSTTQLLVTRASWQKVLWLCENRICQCCI